MTVPAGYVAPAMIAFPVIRDLEGNVRYDHTSLKLMSWDMRGGASSDAGAAVIVVSDDNYDLVDKSDPRRASLIKPGWVLDLYAGQTQSTSQHWFGGPIEQVESISPVHGRHNIAITAVGWAMRLARRFASVDYQQALTVRGQPDGTDTASWISSIVHSIVTDDANRIAGGTEAYPIGAHLEPPDASNLVVGRATRIAGPSDPGDPDGSWGMSSVARPDGRYNIYLQHANLLSLDRYVYDAEANTLTRAQSNLLPLSQVNRFDSLAIYDNRTIFGSYYEQTALEPSTLAYWRTRPESGLDSDNPRFERAELLNDNGRAITDFANARRFGMVVVGGRLLTAEPNDIYRYDVNAARLAAGNTDNILTNRRQLRGFTAAESHGALAYADGRLIYAQNRGNVHDYGYVADSGAITGVRASIFPMSGMTAMAVCGSKLLFCIPSVGVYSADFDATGLNRAALLHDVVSIDEIPIILPRYVRRYQTVAQMVSELAAMANAVWGVDRTNYFFMRVRNKADSGLLITDRGVGPAAPDDRITSTWDPKKRCLMKNAPIEVAADAAQSAYTTVMSVGHVHDITQYERTAAAYNASTDLDENTIVVPIAAAPNVIIRAVRIYLSADNLTDMRGLAVEIYSGGGHGLALHSRIAGAGVSGGTAGRGTLFGSHLIPRYHVPPASTGGLLAADLARAFRRLAGTWITIPVTPFSGYGSRMYVAVRRYTNPANRLRMPYATTGSTAEGAFSTLDWHGVFPGAFPDLTPVEWRYSTHDGRNQFWRTFSGYYSPNLLTGVRAGTMPVQVIRQVRRAAVVRNTTAEKLYMPREAMYPVNEKLEESQIVSALEGISAAVSRPARRYSEFICTPPDLPPPIGKSARVRHAGTGIDESLEIAGWRMSATVRDGKNLHADDMAITMVGRE